LLVAPGLVFAALFVRLQCFPGQAACNRTPAERGLRFEALHRSSAAGVPLAGWYVPPPVAPAPAVLLLHGHGGRKDQYLDSIAFLHREGFGVVAFDMRHHGESGAAVVTFGIREAEETRGFLEDVLSRPEHRGQKVGVLGYSMGAVTALRAAKLYPDVAAVVADSPFSSLQTQSRWRVAAFVGDRLSGYFWPFAMAAGCLATGLAPSAWEVKAWLADIAPRPIFLIHGEDDRNIEPGHSRELVAAAPGPIESWFVPGACHTCSKDARRDEYERRVAEFFRVHLRPARAAARVPAAGQPPGPARSARREERPPAANLGDPP
jgi:pimeloyl-ACP methyl ester carboxylesterase